MTVRFTSQGCKVETTCTIQPNGTYTESVTLSVDPASALSLEIEESAGQAIAARTEQLPPKGSARLRATRHGFELVQR
jgi:hypothetical protein